MSKFTNHFLCLAFCGAMLLGQWAIDAQAQNPKRYNAAELHQSLKKLNVLGSALYIAAHPDDENTRLITWLANEQMMETAYLSLTRGDGGQNLIGPEIREYLGIIRTQELLAARRIDGGKQFFSRANDFGYSKHPDETFNIWDRDQVLADAVWVIRKYQPDVIITRFSPGRAGKTHGHHTASALIAQEAYEAAADPTKFPEQLEYVDTWQAKRVMWNTSYWFYGGRDKFAEVDKSSFVSMDIGAYDPILGKSYNEIAAHSRSQHLSQGFGRSLERGAQMEYLSPIAGAPVTTNDLFEGIDVTWNRLPRTAKIADMLKRCYENFDPENPSEIVPLLLNARYALNNLEDSRWKNIKLAELDEVIRACMGMYLEVTANDYSATPGDNIGLSVELLNRSDIEVVLEKVDYSFTKQDSTLNQTLTNNEQVFIKNQRALPADIKTSQPYWLTNKGTLGMFQVDDQELRGLPENPPALSADLHLKISGKKIVYTLPVVYKWSDPAIGELYRPFVVTPEVFTNIAEESYIFSNDEPQIVHVVVRAGKDNVSGEIELCYGKEWKAEPTKQNFDLKLKGETTTLSYKLYPPKKQEENFITTLAKVNGQVLHNDFIEISYDHFPIQNAFPSTESKVIKIELAKKGNKVGYIMGAGDAIPESLRQIGYEVDLLEDADISEANLAQYDAVIIGVRAYNTNPEMKFHQAKLMKYVENGGTMIVQYNTHRRLKVDMDKIGPYPLKISRDRVTVEEAEVRFLAPDHPVLNTPNKITAKDFEGWVQERGLYFPNEWDDKYTPILSSNDPGEPARDGGLLVAEYGKGHYIYTGYSWFRELPPGVPGAYRIFANLISIGK